MRNRRGEAGNRILQKEGRSRRPEYERKKGEARDRNMRKRRGEQETGICEKEERSGRQEYDGKEGEQNNRI